MPLCYSSIIFDFDGVIVDSATIKADAFAEIYRDEDPGKIRQVVAYQLLHGGVSRRTKFRHFETELFGRAVDEAGLDALCRRYSEIVLDRVLECPFVEGAVEFLERYSGRLPLHVVSGTPHDELGLIIRERDLAKYFVGYIGAPTTKLDAFRSIVAEGGYAPDEVLAVGDSITEYQAAELIGLPFLAIVDGKGASSAFPPEIIRRADLRELGTLVECEPG